MADPHGAQSRHMCMPMFRPRIREPRLSGELPDERVVEELIPLRRYAGETATQRSLFRNTKCFGFCVIASVVAILAPCGISTATAVGKKIQFQVNAETPMSTADTETCFDRVPGWISLEGKSCAQHETDGLCTRNCKYGLSGCPHQHAFKDVQGLTALDICCVCGGGNKVSVLDPSVPQQGVTERKTSVRHPVLDRPPDSRETSVQRPCSWDFENCSETRCCIGYGMQCYAKDNTWAACKRDCKEGVDVYDSNPEPWNCKRIGLRNLVPSVQEETCYRRRTGASFWSGKTFRLSKARNADHCAEVCSNTSWCVSSSWRHESFGVHSMCLLGDKVHTGSDDVLVDPHERCRLASGDLPAVGCARTGRGCVQPRCCKVRGDQCYRWNASYAECMPQCTPGSDRTCQKLGIRMCPACRAPNSEKPAIVVPTFQRDLCKVLILGKSIAKYDPDGHLGDFYLMWISREPSWKYANELGKLKAVVEEGGIRKFVLMDFSEEVRTTEFQCILWSQNGSECRVRMTGWYMQQALKLKIAVSLPVEYYLILDSKNALFTKVERNTFFSPCGQAIIRGQYAYDEIPVPHKTWYEKSAASLGVRPRTDIYWPTSITPALLHKATVLEFLKYIKEGNNTRRICDGDLCTRLAEECTEFSLYYMFAVSQPNIKCNYFFASPGTPHDNIALWRTGGIHNLYACERVANGSISAVTFGLQSGTLVNRSETVFDGRLLQDVENSERTKFDRDQRFDGIDSNITGRGTNSSSDFDFKEIVRRTSQCVAGVYVAAGLAQQPLTGEDLDNFTLCIS